MVFNLISYTDGFLSGRLITGLKKCLLKLSNIQSRLLIYQIRVWGQAISFMPMNFMFAPHYQHQSHGFHSAMYLTKVKEGVLMKHDLVS